MSYSVSSCNPLSSVLLVEDVVCTVEPLLGTAVTVYAVTGAPLAGTTGGVHVTVMDEPEVAMAVTPPGGGGTGQGRRKEARVECAGTVLYSQVKCTIP